MIAAARSNPTKLLISLLFAICGHARDGFSLPIQQVLSRSSSSISFGVDSKAPALQMQGALKDFKGTLSLDLEQLERSFVKMTLNLQSAQLSPDQILQAMFLQTALARVNPPSTTFESTAIAKGKGDTYLLSGMYTWMGKRKNATVPIRIMNASPTKTEIRLLLTGVLQEKEAPRELAAIAPGSAGSKGWAKATLVFLRAPQPRR
jgi:polyisoprenoid-binding protein YceI